MQKQRKTQARLFYELVDIKAEEKRHGRVAYKNKEIAEAHHIPARRACVSPENVGEGIWKKQKAGEELDENEGPSAVLFKRMSGVQKNPSLKAEEREKDKRYYADNPSNVSHLAVFLKKILFILYHWNRKI